jgi:hypothetical protein
MDAVKLASPVCGLVAVLAQKRAQWLAKWQYNAFTTRLEDLLAVS